MSALIYIISALSMLVSFVFLLRFWLPVVGADFRNPIAQGILRMTSPVVNPLRRVVPSIGRIDTATILVLFVIQAGTMLLTMTLMGAQFSAKYIVVSAIMGIVQQSIQIFTFAIIIRIILSWIAPQTYSPVTALLSSLTDPILRPIQRVIPPLGGFDISPIFAIIGLTAFGMLLMDLVRFVV